MVAAPTRLDPDALRLRTLATGSRSAREAALRDLMDAHAPRLHAVATRMLDDAQIAEDVVQETFLKAWTRAADFKPGGARFSTWLSRVTVNACLDRLRKVRPVADTPVERILDDRADARELLERKQTDARVRHAIMDLPDRQRAALVLSVYGGASQAEGADALSISTKAYESLLVRARRALRTELADTQTQRTRHVV